MTSEERIIEIGEDWYNLKKVSEKDRQLLINTYFDATKKRIGTCPACFVTMYNYFKQKNQMETLKKEKSTCDYELHDQKVIWTGDKHITNSNLTNEDALGMLKKSKGAHTHFKKLPNNWMEQAGYTKEELVDETETKSTIESKSDSEKRAKLKGKKIIELQEVAANLELPEENWIGLKQKELVDYLVANS